MGWILLFGPFIGGMLIAITQVLVYRCLCKIHVLKTEQVPDGPVIVMQSFIILIVVMAIVYFTGLANGIIETVDPRNPPEGFIGQ